MLLRSLTRLQFPSVCWSTSPHQQPWRHSFPTFWLKHICLDWFSAFLCPFKCISYSARYHSPFTCTHTCTLSLSLTQQYCQPTFKRLTSNLPKRIPNPLHRSHFPHFSLSLSLSRALFLSLNIAQQVAPLQSPLGIRGLSGVPESRNYAAAQVI